MLLYVRRDIPSRLLTEQKSPNNIECLLLGVNIGKKKMVDMFFVYPYRNNIVIYNLHYLRKGLDIYLKNYDNIIIWVDLNCETSTQYLDASKHASKIQINRLASICF